MHVLVATDGSVDTERAAAFAQALAGPEGATTVGTIVRVPRRMVHDLREKYGDQDPVHVDSDGEYVGSPRSGAVLEKGWPGEDALIGQDLGDKRIERCGPVVEAIRAAGGTADSKVAEGEDVEQDIMDMAAEIGADVIVVGAHGKNAFQGLLGSGRA